MRNYFFVYLLISSFFLSLCLNGCEKNKNKKEGNEAISIEEQKANADNFKKTLISCPILAEYNDDNSYKVFFLCKNSRMDTIPDCHYGSVLIYDSYSGRISVLSQFINSRNCFRADNKTVFYEDISMSRKENNRLYLLLSYEDDIVIYIDMSDNSIHYIDKGNCSFLSKNIIEVYKVPQFVDEGHGYYIYGDSVFYYYDDDLSEIEAKRNSSELRVSQVDKNALARKAENIETGGREYNNSNNDSYTNNDSYASSNKRSVTYRFTSDQSVMAYLSSQPFYGNDITVVIKSYGIFLNGSCVTGAPVVEKFESYKALVRAYTPYGTRISFIVDPYNNCIIDSENDVYYAE